MTYYIGDFNVEGILGVGVPRFFYGLRRTADGELYLGRLDQLDADDVIEINQPGIPEDNYNDFEVGTDFFEGIDVNHDIVYRNLTYQQYRWDNRNLFYYIDDDGQLVVRISEEYQYPTGI
jgi:hypothetical protein